MFQATKNEVLFNFKIILKKRGAVGPKRDILQGSEVWKRIPAKIVAVRNVTNSNLKIDLLVYEKHDFVAVMIQVVFLPVLESALTQ